MDKHIHLTRRERQIMDIIYRQCQATVSEIQRQLPQPPAHTAVRTFLKILGSKGYVKRKKQGRQYIYSAKGARTPAGRSALRRVIQTFFDGSLEQALGAHLTDRSTDLSEKELKRAVDLINQARKRGN